MSNVRNRKISCLLNSLNKPKFLPEAVDSVLNQTYKNFELIIVDGGSTAPGMKQLLARYEKHPKIKVMFTGETEKDRKTKIMHSVAMNMALEKAKGEYITYLCDDDIYYPERFEKMLEKFKENQKISVVYSWMKLCNMDLDGKKSNCYIRKIWGLRGKKAKPNLPIDTYVDGIAFMHKKSCLKELKKPYWPEGPKSEQWHYDGIFAEKLGEKFIFYPLEEVTFEHRFTPISTNYRNIPKWRIYAQHILGMVSKNKFAADFE